MTNSAQPGKRGHETRAIFAEHPSRASQLGGRDGWCTWSRISRLGRREAPRCVTPPVTTPVARFEREVHGGQARHPSIADIYHYGTTDSGRPWFTMVYVEGTDLTKATLTDAEAITVLRSVAEAIDYRTISVVHRDIKPAWMVSRNRSGRIDRAYVLDFGIARPEGDPRITHANMYIGTVAHWLRNVPATRWGLRRSFPRAPHSSCSARKPVPGRTVTQLMIAIATWHRQSCRSTGTTWFPPIRCSSARWQETYGSLRVRRRVHRRPRAVDTGRAERWREFGYLPAQAAHVRYTGRGSAWHHPPVHKPDSPESGGPQTRTGQLGYGHAQGGTSPTAPQYAGRFPGWTGHRRNLPAGCVLREQPLAVPASRKVPGRLAWLVGIGTGRVDPR